MPKTAKQYTEEIQEVWDAADREGRNLTPRRAGADGAARREREGSAQPGEADQGDGPGRAVARPDGRREPGLRRRPRRRVREVGGVPADRGSGRPRADVDYGADRGFVGAVRAADEGHAARNDRWRSRWRNGPAVLRARRRLQAVRAARVADVFGQSQTTASQVRYVNEGTATSGAAGVAEAGTK